MSEKTLVQYSLDGRKWQTKQVMGMDRWVSYSVLYDDGVIEPLYVEQFRGDMQYIRYWPRGVDMAPMMIGEPV
jgi:hypothetical protein